MHQHCGIVLAAIILCGLWSGAAEAARPAAPETPAEARLGWRPPLPAGEGAVAVAAAFPPAGCCVPAGEGGAAAGVTATTLVTSPVAGTAIGPSP